MSWITGKNGKDEAKDDGGPIRNADAFAALQHEQEADTYDGGHAYRSHAHCGHHPGYERPCFVFVVFFVVFFFHGQSGNCISLVLLVY